MSKPSLRDEIRMDCYHIHVKYKLFRGHICQDCGKTITTEMLIKMLEVE